MTKGKRILRAVFGVIMSALFFLSIVAFFVMPASASPSRRASTMA